ncbi:MAG TPA: hypothetical protein VFH37_03340 [Candidatus Saccharimonadales bacterium]|nr:hypothetical protein [Candidatus Saccharimonadales bacterium]
MPPETLEPQAGQPTSDPASTEELEALNNLPSAKRSEPVSADGLNQHFAIPTAPEPTYDQPGNQPEKNTPTQKSSKSKSPDSQDDLAKKEGVGGEMGDIVGSSLYSHSSREFEHKGLAGLRNKLFVVHRRRTIAGGGILGTIIGIVLFLTLGTGPFQIVQFAHLLEQFHFASQQNASDNRVMKLARFINYGSKGELQYTRVGVFQAKWGKTIESDLNKSGIESAYSKKLSYFDGYIIDPEHLANTELSDLKGKSPADIKTVLEQKFPDATIETHPNDPGKLFINAKDLGYRKSLSLTQFMLEASGKNKLAAAIEARVMGGIYGLTWHPFTVSSLVHDNLDTETNFEKNLADEEYKGETAAEIETATSTGKNDQTGAANATAAEGEANSTQSAGQSAGNAAGSGDPNALNNFRDSIHIKLAGGAAGAAGVLCILKGLGDKADEIKQAEVILPLARMASVVISGGNQVESGQDIDLTQVGYLSKQFVGKDAAGQQTSWIDAQSIQAELGHPNTGVSPDDTLNSIGKSGNPFSFLSTDGLGTILGPVCSTVGQGVLAVLTFFGASVADLTQQIVFAAVGPSLENTIAHWIAGKPVDALGTVGADFGNYVNYGARIAGNGAAITNGATALSDQQSAELNGINTSIAQKQFNQHSIAYRIFDPTDPKSAIAKIVDNASPSFNTNLASIGRLFINFGSTLTKLPSLLFGMAHASAATQYNYGFPEYGFSQEDLSNPAVENPYQNAEDAVGILNGPNGSTYIDRADQCFGVKISQDSQGNWNVDNQSIPAYDKIPSSCTDSSTDWLKIRFFIFDTKTADSLGCYYGDDQACSNVGFSNPNPTATSTPAPSGGDSLPAGSVQDLAKQLVPFVNSGKIKCASGDGIHNINCSDIINTASGKSIRADSCQVDALSAGLLGMLLKLVQMGHTFILSALCSDHPTIDGPGGHNGGRAADFNTIDGTFMGPNDTSWTGTKIKAGSGLDRDIASFMPKSTGFGQLQCHPTFSFLSGFSVFNDTCNHQHVQVEI